MLDVKSYRIIIASVGSLIVILGIGMVACGVMGKPIPQEFTNLELVAVSGLLGLFAPSPLQPQPTARRNRSYSEPEEITELQGPDDRFKRR